MKLQSEPDLFKASIRRQYAENPVRSATDAELWEKISAQIEKDKHKSSSGILRKINLVPIYAKAAIVLLVMSAALGIYYWNGGFSANTLVENKVSKEKIIKHTTVKKYNNVSQVDQPVAVEDGEKVVYSKQKIRNYDLSDGSLVALNTGSSIQIEKDFNKETRTLTLEGEAYFEVQPDREKPFKVYFDGAELEVKGTKFNVRNVGGENYKEITVAEGIVSVKNQADAKPVKVRAGEQVKIYENEISKVSRINALNYISWKTGDLIFKNARLEEVALLLSRLYKKEIIVDNNIKNCKYTGDLSGLSLDECLEIIKITNSVIIQKSEKNILISGVICD